MPDNTFMMVNGSIDSVIRSAAAVPVRDVIGLPSWLTTDRYDMTTRPPAGSTCYCAGQALPSDFTDTTEYS